MRFSSRRNLTWRKRSRTAARQCRLCLCCPREATRRIRSLRWGESKTSGDKKCKYIIFPWGNSCGCFHDVFRERSDRWQEVSYEKVDVEHPRTWHANFVWKIRRQGISGYRTVEGPPPKGYGKNEGEELQILNSLYKSCN